MDNTAAWIGKDVTVIMRRDAVEPPSDLPQEGILVAIANTYVIIKQGDLDVLIPFSSIQRMTYHPPATSP